jgi:hypothetical protein
VRKGVVRFEGACRERERERERERASERERERERERGMQHADKNFTRAERDLNTQD